MRCVFILHEALHVFADYTGPEQAAYSNAANLGQMSATPSRAYSSTHGKDMEMSRHKAWTMSGPYSTIKVHCQ